MIMVWRRNDADDDDREPSTGAEHGGPGPNCERKRASPIVANARRRRGREREHEKKNRCVWSSEELRGVELIAQDRKRIGSEATAFIYSPLAGVQEDVDARRRPRSCTMNSTPLGVREELPLRCRRCREADERESNSLPSSTSFTCTPPASPIRLLIIESFIHSIRRGSAHILRPPAQRQFILKIGERGKTLSGVLTHKVQLKDRGCSGGDGVERSAGVSCERGELLLDARTPLAHSPSARARSR